LFGSCASHLQAFSRDPHPDLGGRGVHGDNQQRYTEAFQLHRRCYRNAAHIHQSTPVELIVGFNFAINNNSASQTIPAGQTASYTLDVVPLGNDSVFPGNVTLSCATVGMPSLSSCTFTPAQVASGQGDTNVMLKVVTPAASASAKLTGTPHLLWYDLGLAVAGVLLTLGGVKKSRGRGKKAGGRLGILSALLGVLVACGGGSSGGSAGGGGVGAGHPGTTPGNYTITITGTVGSVTRTAEAVLTVK